MISDIQIRPALSKDLEAIIRLHEADARGHGDAWQPDLAKTYRSAFAEIERHPDHTVFVAERGGIVVGTMMVSVLPGLTGRGARHAQIRSVQVRSDVRSLGIGASMIAFAESWAKSCGASVVELMSNAARTDAHRFYERLGYPKSHVGFQRRV